MTQMLNLSITGLYTSMSDFTGIPEGALTVADNGEIRYSNIYEPRRGFVAVTGTLTTALIFNRLSNFYILGTNRSVGLTSTGSLLYYNSSWTAFPGSVGTGLVNPDATYAKCRLLLAGQNLYCTSQDGIRSIASGSGSNTVYAGVPKALNIDAVTTGASSGFFTNNIVNTTTGTVTNASAALTNISDTTGLVEGMYVGGTAIPVGTKISSIQEEATIIIVTGNTTAGSAVIANVTSVTGLTAGALITGDGIPAGALYVSNGGGAGPFSVTISLAALRTEVAAVLTFSSPLVVNMDQNATGSHTAEAITFYNGSEVGYRILYGRIETDIRGNTVTRLGSPSPIAVAFNTSATDTTVTVTATLPKNSSQSLGFLRLYRSPQTPSISPVEVTPLDQYKLAYERALVAGDFTARVVTITDIVPDANLGVALYAGNDQEGILQSNDPPPMAWDMTKFRDLTLFGNITRPTTTEVTLLAVGAASGLQINDTITISGTFVSGVFTETYTASAAENQAARQFKVFSTGSPSQNVTDTADSLIRVVNYDNALPVHAILLSTTTDLSGQMLFEADLPGLATFNMTTSAHASAWDPVLTNLVSSINTINNGLAISKQGELEAVPAVNFLPIGDSSADIYRVIGLRDYAICIKSDGVYKIHGLTPASMVVTPFDLTTKIIGSDTAVSLNSSVWMFSNQGVVVINDGGVEAKSIPIDNDLNILIGSYLSEITTSGFAVGYESDRKYILGLPTSIGTTYAQIEYCYNYITNAWTTWSRNFYTGYINQLQNLLYVSCADASNTGVSYERKTYTYTDYTDEAIPVTIVSGSGTTWVLNTVSGIEVGDVLYQSGSLFSVISSISITNTSVTVADTVSFTVAAASILTSYLVSLTWNEQYGENPAFVKQFSEGIALFKNANFETSTFSFITDFSLDSDDIPVDGVGNGFWGLFAYGDAPWGGDIHPNNIRFLIPQDKQLGSYLIPSFSLQQSYTNFRLQGLAILNYPVGPEVGR